MGSFRHPLGSSRVLRRQEGYRDLLALWELYQRAPRPLCGALPSVEGPLRQVLAWCFNPDLPDHPVVRNAIEQHGSPDEIEGALNALPYRLPRTAERAARLLWSAHIEGFAAFG